MPRPIKKEDDPVWWLYILTSIVRFVLIAMICTSTYSYEEKYGLLVFVVIASSMFVNLFWGLHVTQNM